MSLVKPVHKDDFKITSGFGTRIHPIHKIPIFHNGIDISVPCGTKVFSVDDGTIQKIGISPTKGRFINIDHGNNLISVYWHLSKFSSGLKKNDKVYQDQLIGLSGGGLNDPLRGISNGCHLHYGLKKNGKWIDPSKDSLYLTDFQKIITGILSAFIIYKYLYPYFQKFKKEK